MQRHAVDDDNRLHKASSDKSISEEVDSLSITTTTVELDINAVNSNPAEHQQDSKGEEAPVLDMAKRLSCKWSSGVGPRIGCVREYPTELQFRALEQVKLSPTSHVGTCGPIPSPRPSPKIRMSPRLAYMGLPSPRVSAVSAN